ncbi:hypothetical protein FGG08_002768 [Glutinoglossum americanum]|uniref:Uncharacterized protein n=1 Tax=Glutinoglossum americanum TaxID=1670608 RepID=A0A9P8HZN1_9PEZI|nr:hypothetical protein FGG08_002768 [Glutinoglossum americanum]
MDPSLSGNGDIDAPRPEGLPTLELERVFDFADRAESPKMLRHGALPGEARHKDLNYLSRSKETHAPPALPLTRRNLSENDRLCADMSKGSRQQSSKLRAAAKSLGLDRVLGKEESYEGMMPMERLLAEMGAFKERKVKWRGRS